jgi:hypothetical protein
MEYFGAINRRGLVEQRCRRLADASAAVNRASGMSYLDGDGHGRIALVTTFIREAALRRRMRRQSRIDDVVKSNPIQGAGRAGFSDIELEPRRPTENRTLYESSPLVVGFYGEPMSPSRLASNANEQAGASENAVMTERAMTAWTTAVLATFPSKLIIVPSTDRPESHQINSAQADGATGTSYDLEERLRDDKYQSTAADFVGAAAYCSRNVHTTERWRYGSRNSHRVSDRGALQGVVLAAAESGAMSARNATAPRDGELDLAFVSCAHSTVVLAERLNAVRRSTSELVFIDCLSNRKMPLATILWREGAPEDIRWAADDPADNQEAQQRMWRDAHREPSPPPTARAPRDERERVVGRVRNHPEAEGLDDYYRQRTPAPKFTQPPDPQVALRKRLRGDPGSTMRVVSRFLIEFGREWHLQWRCSGTVFDLPTTASPVAEGSPEDRAAEVPTTTGCLVLSRRPPESSKATVARLKAVYVSVKPPEAASELGSMAFTNLVFRLLLANSKRRHWTTPERSSEAVQAAYRWLRDAQGARDAAHSHVDGTRGAVAFSPYWWCATAVKATVSCAVRELCQRACGTERQLADDSRGADHRHYQQVDGGGVKKGTNTLAGWIADIVNGGLVALERRSIFEAAQGLMTPVTPDFSGAPTDGVAVTTRIADRTPEFTLLGPEVTVSNKLASEVGGVTSFATEVLVLLNDAMLAAESILVVGCDESLAALALHHHLTRGVRIGFVDITANRCPNPASATALDSFLAAEVSKDDPGVTHARYSRFAQTPQYDVAVMSLPGLLRSTEADPPTPPPTTAEAPASDSDALPDPPVENRRDHSEESPVPVIVKRFGIVEGINGEDPNHPFWVPADKGSDRRLFNPRFSAGTIVIVDVFRGTVNGVDTRQATRPFEGLQHYEAASAVEFDDAVTAPADGLEDTAVLTVGGGVMVYRRRADAPELVRAADLDQGDRGQRP